MRPAANFNPEWGYLAPTPRFFRTARIALVATALGAILGAAVGFTRVDHQATESSVAARTMVRPMEAVPAGANTPALATQANALSEKRSLTVNSRSADGAANEPSASSTARAPGSTTAVAEVSATTDGPAAATIVAPPRTTKEPVLNIAPHKKRVTKKSNGTWRFALRDESVGLASGEYYPRRGWGGYYGDSGGRRYQNW